MTKVLVFGVFDGLHKGHLFFLKQAKTLGNYLIVALARDLTVLRLKGRPPIYNQESRKASLLESGIVDKVYFGDKILGRYSVIKKARPDIVVLGYDQDELYKNLSEFLKKSKISVKLLKLRSCYKPEIYHSGLINSKTRSRS